VSADPPSTTATSAGAHDEPVVVQVYASTDVGLTREHNEDTFLVADLGGAEPLDFQGAREIEASPCGLLFMVADGMGGAAAGELASEMAVSVVFEELRKRWPGTGSRDAFAAALRDATAAANDTIHAYAVEHPETRGMGTTATAAGLLGDTLYVAQVGDSRAYLVREGVALQITKDQSLIQRLVEAGELTPEEAELSERRNIILQALGPEASVKVDLTHQTVRRGDTLILCSDGLSGQVKPEEMGQAVRESPDLATVCASLVDLANARGGPDNITIVAARFVGDGLSASSAADAVGHAVYRMPGTTPEGPFAAVNAPAPAVRTPAPLDPALLEARRARARTYYVALAIAAAVVAGVLVWELLPR
jgi:serine/threonine protein phosphatase PrpC